jgi:hypothetical protein
MAQTPFAGINRSVAVDTLAGMRITASMPLTRESLERAAERIRQMPISPPFEIHSPDCPKYRTQGRKACRCSTAWWEGMLEDELENRAELEATT